MLFKHSTNLQRDAPFAAVERRLGNEVLHRLDDAFQQSRLDELRLEHFDAFLVIRDDFWIFLSRNYLFACNDFARALKRARFSNFGAKMMSSQRKLDAFFEIRILRFWVTVIKTFFV